MHLFETKQIQLKFFCKVVYRAVCLTFLTTASENNICCFLSDPHHTHIVAKVCVSDG